MGNLELALDATATAYGKFRGDGLVSPGVRPRGQSISYLFCFAVLQFDGRCYFLCRTIADPYADELVSDPAVGLGPGALQVSLACVHRRRTNPPQTERRRHRRVVPDAYVFSSCRLGVKHAGGEQAVGVLAQLYLPFVANTQHAWAIDATQRVLEGRRLSPLESRRVFLDDFAPV